MKELKIKLVATKTTDILYGKDCIMQLHDNYLFFTSDYAYERNKDNEDIALGRENVSVFEHSYVKKSEIFQVSVAYWMEEESWFVKLGVDKSLIEFNVDSKESGIEIVETIKQWLFG